MSKGRNVYATIWWEARKRREKWWKTLPLGFGVRGASGVGVAICLPMRFRQRKSGSMMNHYGLLLSILVGYLLGSIPFGLIVSKGRGIDIRQHGSGNIGATNVLRVLGKKWGILVFLLDALKGVAAVLAARLLFATIGESSLSAGELGIVGALACIMGHNFPIWLGFKGGKGVATTAGVLLGLMPVAALAAFVSWMVVFYTTRYVSVASMVAAVVIPTTVWFVEGRADAIFWFSVAVGLLAIWRHRSNIQRLMAGTENRFEKKKK